MKPYQSIAIRECGEPLVAIPVEQFAVIFPHAYVKLAAPYGNKSPYYLRQSVVEALLQAQRQLQQEHPRWRIQIFDAYRPIAVQQYMVDYTLAEAIAAEKLTPETLTAAQRQTLLEQVHQFWAEPSRDPATPPPHSTGAAVDVTLVDATGQAVDMGSAIDEMSPRSYPDYFAQAIDPLAAHFHQQRQILRQAMLHAGFCQHPNEWWHFSLGDQMWAWLVGAPIARYGSCTNV